MPRKKVQKMVADTNGQPDKTTMPLGYPSDPRIPHPDQLDPPMDVKLKRMPHPEQLNETVHCSISEITFAFQTDRPQLVKLYKPTGPVTAAEAKQLAEFVRVLMETNHSLRMSHAAMELRVKELEDHCLAVRVAACQLNGLAVPPPKPDLVVEDDE